MTKAVLERVDVELKRRRTEVTRLHAELEDLEDYLDVLEARRRSVGRRNQTQADMEKRYRTED
jgi:Skp family chaperone for outer membrane proteins